MIRRALLLALFLSTTVAARPAAAQRRGGGGGDGGPRGAPAPAADNRSALPTIARVREGANAPGLLAEKHRKLGLAPAAVDSLKRLAAAVDARNAPRLETYDSLRTRLRAAQNAPSEDGATEGRERMRLLGETVRALGEARRADIEAAMALVPAEKQDEARKLLAEQEEDLRKAGGGRGPGGPAGPGGPRRP